MRSQKRLLFWIAITAMLAPLAGVLPARSGVAAGIQWQQDLDAAKATARDSGRLVLVHVWTPSCGPCLALEQNVFNQPGVAGALEARFVPVKLNANEQPAVAQSLGITRVPTDVILTPTGEVVGQLVSPPTPGAYVAELTQIANQHSMAANAFAHSVATAPHPAQLNAAYAKLPVTPQTSIPAPQSLAANPQSTPARPVASATAQPTTAAPSATTNPFATPAPTAAAPPTAAQTTPFAGHNPPTSAPFASASTPPAPQPAVVTNPAAQAAATSAPSTSGAPDVSKLPPGAPPLGFEGYCPVSMRNSWKWVPGDPRWGVVHRGRTYWFAGEAEQKQFWSDPDRYSPALSGNDPVLAIDHQQQVPGKREHSLDYDNLFYMFSSEATLQQFTANPERYAVSVRQAMGIERGRLVR